jgi:probable HAF family extracellular repeat protein
MINLNTLIDSASGWHLAEAKAINDAGQIVGTGKNKAGQRHACLLTPDQAAAITAAAETPAAQGKRNPGASRNVQPLPTGWVRIINRGTGVALHIGRGNEGPFRLERSGDHYQIRSEQPGGYVGLAGWASKEEYASKPPERRHQFFLSVATASESLLSKWRIEPVSDGFWTIRNLATGKCLEIRNEKPALWHSQFRKGALEQQWRFVLVGTR